MNNRTILALAGLAMLSLSAISTIGLGSSSSVQAQSLQSNQNSNTTVSIVKNNATMDDVKQHLHTQLDGAIMAAQNNDTFGVLMGLGQITEGLAAINTPEYFLFEDPLYNNGTMLANASETSATGSN
jgi:ABC-type antimicrobial peptide transport system permease subunit